MSFNFVVCRENVHNRGGAPQMFLDELVTWGKAAPDEIFTPNSHFDIYSSVKSQLGPWEGLIHRRAVMLEVLRVLGGFESSWNWQAGVDVTNPTSNTPCSEEAGIFQCSGNSMNFSPSLKSLLVSSGGDGSCQSFIQVTKQNRQFAIEYCARLLRITTMHHGPIKGNHIHPWLNRSAAQELQAAIAQ